MKIGIDGSCLSNRRGFGRFARRLLEALAAQTSPHHYSVFVDAPSADLVHVPPGMERVVVPVAQAPSQAARAQGRRRLRDMFAMGRAAARSRLDLMYFPATYTFFPVWNVGKLVITMHDALPLAHPELVFPTAAGRLSWRFKELTAARMADRVVTVSEASRRDLAQWVPGGADRIRLITEGPDDIFGPRDDPSRTSDILEHYHLPTDRRYLLYVGGLSPHKNLPRLIEAFATIPDRDIHLVLVGDLGDVFHTHVPAIREAITRHTLNDRVHLTGFVPDDDLVLLYNRATALVQPSLLEGFGLPAVEAMACGTPVLASRAGSLPEVVGDAGMFFDPRDPTSIAETLTAFLSDTNEATRLGTRALERAGLFTWNRAAKMLLDCFDELATSDATRPALARGA